MNFVTSYIATADAKIPLLDVEGIHTYERLIGESIGNENIISPFSKIIFSPTIIADSKGFWNDKISYSNKEGAINVRVNISHQKWISSSVVEQVELLAEAILFGISKIKPSALSESEKKKIIDIVLRDKALLIEDWKLNRPHLLCRP